MLGVFKCFQYPQVRTSSRRRTIITFRKGQPPGLATVEKSVRGVRRNGNCGFQQSWRSRFPIPPPLMPEALILRMCT
jgi:hypothetical protein